MSIDHGPAVHERMYGHENPEFDYPARFHDRVPKTVRMKRTARPDVFMSMAKPHLEAAKQGAEYPAWTNRHGAVSAILPDGEKLGLYPSEFEVVEWLE